MIWAVKEDPVGVLTSLSTHAYDVEDLFSNWSRNSLNVMILKFQAFYYLITAIIFYKA